MPPEVKALAGHTGAKSEFIESRAAYLASKDTADAIMVVNTLHHIPFREIAGQVGALLRKLRPGGVLAGPRDGRPSRPRAARAWRVENPVTLFQGEEFTCNPRSTESRSGVPLCHAIIAQHGHIERRDGVAVLNHGQSDLGDRGQKHPGDLEWREATGLLHGDG
jgi:hypothetical protein